MGASPPKKGSGTKTLNSLNLTHTARILSSSNVEVRIKKGFLIYARGTVTIGLWQFRDCPLLTFYLLPPSRSNVVEFLVLETGFFLNNLDKFK